MDSPAAHELATLVARLSAPSPASDDAERIERIHLMEQVKSALCAAQARESVAFEESQLALQDVAGVPARDRGKGIAAQVALARHESHHRGRRTLGLARVLVRELPHTMRALESGEINEWRASLVAKSTACLSLDDRRRVDAELSGRLSQWGDRRIELEAKKIAYRLDPHAFVARIRKAESERCVTLRPAPDAMAYLTALVPLKQGVAGYAALCRAADLNVSDERGRGQVMADTLVERITGQAVADQVPIEVQLTMSDRVLSGASDHAAVLTGPGGVPFAVPAPGRASWSGTPRLRPGSGVCTRTVAAGSSLSSPPDASSPKDCAS